MGMAFGSINTGLPKNIVGQIIAAERDPINKLEGRKGKLNEKNQLLNELNNLVKELRTDVEKNANAKDFAELKVITNEEIVNVTVDKDFAKPGEYQMEVKNLAKKSSAMTTAFEDPDESYVGVGFIQYQLPNGEGESVYVDEDHASLRGVMNLINARPDAGLKANLINDGKDGNNQWRLILTLTKTGDNNRAEFPYFYFVDGEDDFSLEEQREAMDAVVNLDGFDMELHENSSKDLIPGLNIEFKKAKPGEEFTIRIVQDFPIVKDKVKSIVDKVNKVLTFINVQNTLNEKSDTSRTLGGDLTLQTLQGKIRDVVFSPVLTREGSRRLGDYGIKFQKTGLLELDEKKLEAQLSKEFITVTDFMTGYFDKEEEIQHEGFLSKLTEITKQMIRIPDGPLMLRKDGIRKSIDQIDSQIANKERILAQREQMLKDKFARLEGAMSKLKSQGAGLASLSAGVDPITQLAGAN